MGPLLGMSGYTAPRPAPEPHAVVEYARTQEQAAESARLFGESLDTFYADARSKGAPAFVGD
jgi:hypothetical protein